MMHFENFFESALSLNHPLFDLEDDLEVFGLLVDDDGAIIFSRKEDSRFIFFPGNEFHDLWEKHYGRGFFEASIYPSFGREKYQWLQIESSKENLNEIFSLKEWIQHYSQDVGHYVKATAPIKELKNEVMIIEKIQCLKIGLNSFSYFMPVYTKNFPNILTFFVDVKKFCFFWEMNKEEVYVNIHDINGPIIFGKLPNQILAMISPGKMNIREILGNRWS